MAIVSDAITRRVRCIIASLNLHGLYVQHRDPDTRDFYEHADYVRIDGMPIVLIGRLAGHPLRRDHRVTWLDWLWPLMQTAASRGWRIYYVGGKPGVAARAAERIRAEVPAIRLETASGYFDGRLGSGHNEQVITDIAQFCPDVLMVGMGMPRQERWIADNLARIEAPVILPCGACFDYIADVIPTPPRWMGRLGLEWFHRLYSEPRRLGHRYLIEPWFVAALLLRHMIRSRRSNRERIDTE